MTDVEKIKEKIDIIAFIGEHVPLKKAGRNFRTNCPFHNEKTPSFNVSADRQVWYCFGCGKGGDLFTFLMELEHIDFNEALHTLADRAGVALTQQVERSGEDQQRERLLKLQHLASEYYHYILTKHETAEPARQYLHDRKIRDEIIKTFMLGYAPNSWESTANYLRKKGFTEEELEMGGLVVKGKTRGYDRFRGRLMFPIRDHRGRVIAFSGRILDNTVKEAKYINSPETSLYIKGNTLYGLDVTKDAIRKSGTAIIVEGEFDLLSSFEDGVTNVVAIKGSALTAGHIRLLKRFTDTLIFALDGDMAGDTAARRGIELADKEGFLMKVVQLAAGKDPDECVKAGRGLWKKAVNEAIPIYDYFLTSSLSRFDAESVEGKKRISEEFIPVVARIDNPIIQAHYIRLLSQKINIPEETVREATNRQMKLVKVEAITHVKPEPITTKPTREEQLEELVLAMVLQSADHDEVERFSREIGVDDFTLPALGKIWQITGALISPRVSLPLFDHLTNVPPELAPTLDRLVLLDIGEFHHSKKAREELLYEFKRSMLRRKIRLIATKMKQAEVTDDEILLSKQSEELAKLTETLKTLA